MRRKPLLLTLGLLLSLSGCFLGGPPTVKGLYRDALSDYAGHDGGGGLTPRVRERMKERYETVITWHAEGRLEEPQDLLYAGALLVTSDRLEHLLLARELAQLAAERGERRGFPVVAEATDKMLLSDGQPQRYGTQIIYVPVLQRWELYPVDPATTDEERAAMGVPPLAELEAYARQQNDSAIGRRLRKADEEEERPEFLERPR